MPNIIRIKRSASAANVPATSSLLHGELAINTADGKLFYGKVDGSIGTLGGGVAAATAVTTVTTTYAALSGDSVILANATTAAFTVTLPTAAGATGKAYTVKKTDGSANAVTLATTSAQTIDGGATATLNYPYTSLTVISDGSNWEVI